MKLLENGKLPFYKFESLKDIWPLRHAISTRRGGGSLPPYESLNLALNIGDDVAKVVNNRVKVCSVIDASINKFVGLEQPHSANVYVLRSPSDLGGFDDWSQVKKNVDAIITNIRGITLFTFSADCALILFFDPVHEALGLAHAGWRGTILNICHNVVRSMQVEYGSNPEDIFVGIGPVICSNDLNINENSGHNVRELLTSSGNGYTLNIQDLLIHQLVNLGITNIETANICTAENTNLFYSFEKEGTVTGRFGIIAYLI
jgi:YfiH family protein